jgi:hypothetical protein
VDFKAPSKIESPFGALEAPMPHYDVARTTEEIVAEVARLRTFERQLAKVIMTRSIEEDLVETHLTEVVADAFKQYQFLKDDPIFSIILNMITGYITSIFTTIGLTTVSAFSASLASKFGSRSSRDTDQYTSGNDKVGYGLHKHIDRHDDNMHKIKALQAGHVSRILSRHHRPITPSDFVDDMLMAQPPYSRQKYQIRQAQGCGFCGGTHDLMGHAKQHQDVVCQRCLNARQMTPARYTARDTPVVPIRESPHKYHKDLVAAHDMNDYIRSVAHVPTKSKWEEFDESAGGLDRRFMRRMSTDYIMDRKHIPKIDTPRLAYLLGALEHDKENINTNHKANLQSMITNHLAHHQDPKPASFNLNKLASHKDIVHEINTRPGVLKHMQL